MTKAGADGEVTLRQRREEEGKGPSGNASFYIFFQVRGFHLIGGEIQVYSEEQTADFNHANE